MATFEDRCGDFRRSMYRLSKIDDRCHAVSTFDSGVLRQPQGIIADVAFTRARAACDYAMCGKSGNVVQISAAALTRCANLPRQRPLSECLGWLARLMGCLTHPLGLEYPSFEIQ